MDEKDVKNQKRGMKAFEPALQIGKERKYISFLSSSFVKGNLLLSVGLIISISANFFFAYKATEVRREYFASDNGRIFPLIPLSQPYQKPSSVIQYVTDTLNPTFTLDFLNWRQQLEAVRSRYTVIGFKSMIDSLQASGILSTVRDKRMNMSVSSGAGVLVKEGVEDGRYVWVVEVPIQVKLSGQTTELPAQKFIATVRIERIPTLDSIEGIGVAQVITKPM